MRAMRGKKKRERGCIFILLIIFKTKLIKIHTHSYETDSKNWVPGNYGHLQLWSGEKVWGEEVDGWELGAARLRLFCRSATLSETSKILTPLSLKNCFRYLFSIVFVVQLLFQKHHKCQPLSAQIFFYTCFQWFLSLCPPHGNTKNVNPSQLKCYVWHLLSMDVVAPLTFQKHKNTTSQKCVAKRKFIRTAHSEIPLLHDFKNIQ